MLEVTIVSPQDLLFTGRAEHLTLPGEQGVFEVWSFHRALMTRLLPGHMVVDGEVFPIRRGVVKVAQEAVVAIVEPDHAPRDRPLAPSP